jgi:hypothetical protein
VSRSDFTLSALTPFALGHPLILPNRQWPGRGPGAALEANRVNTNRNSYTPSWIKASNTILDTGFVNVLFLQGALDIGERDFITIC